jgi:hypothetical protein
MPFSEVTRFEEDVMSLSLLVTTVLDKLRTPDGPAPAAPVHESPHQQRERLRQQVLARGGTVSEVETIRGDCPAQTAQQITDLTQWLSQPH